MSLANNIIPLTLAITAWLGSYVVASLFKETTYMFYLLLFITDFLFIYLISGLPMSIVYKRFMAILLTLTLVVSGIGAINEYLYSINGLSGFWLSLYEGVFPLISWVAIKMDYLYKDFSLVVSSLLCVVSITPKGLLDVINGRFWPRSLDFVYYNYAENGMEDPNKNSWDSRRGAKGK